MKYLDLKKLEFNNDIVELDDYIADAILELNKKGYKTAYSCSGHSEKKAAVCEDQGVNVMTYDGKDYSVFIYEELYVYVTFDVDCNFTTLPEGFVYQTKTEEYEEALQLGHDTTNRIFRDSLRRRIDSTNKTSEEVDKELKEANQKLYEWAKGLEPLKEKHM